MNLKAIVQGIQLSFRSAVGATLAYAIAERVDLEYPIYAFVAAVIVTELSPIATRELGRTRFVATLVGAVCGSVLTHVVEPVPWSLGLGIYAAMQLAHFVGAASGAKVAGYVSGVVILTHSGDAWTYAFHRVVETALGIAVAWLLSFVPKLLRVGEEPRAEAPRST
jgi:uncharacterized membrane protein YgaE (UPF0421/DUF939 family)